MNTIDRKTEMTIKKKKETKGREGLTAHCHLLFTCKYNAFWFQFKIFLSVLKIITVFSRKERDAGMQKNNN